MFEICFIAQVCCQLLLCAKQNNNHKFCHSHMEAQMDDYTSNGEVHIVCKSYHTPVIYTIISIIWMNVQNNTGIIL